MMKTNPVSGLTKAFRGWRRAATAAAAGILISLEPLHALTLEEALERAERNHPQLAEAHARVDAAAGRAEQAGSLPNPELVAGAQQLPLDSGASNQREYIAGIAQSVPPAGRLGKARRAELLEQEVQRRELEVVRRKIQRGVHSAFATALYQSLAAEAQEENVAAGRRAVSIVKARLDAGDAAADDLARTELELWRARAESQRAESLHQQSLRSLAEAMGEPRSEIGSLEGSLEDVFNVPGLERLAARLDAHPEMLKADAERNASRAREDLARAERIPDIKVEALYHRLEATRENTIDLGVSIPLPLFNRNHGAIREARALSDAAEARSRLTQMELAARLQSAHTSLAAAIETRRLLKDEVLPRAELVLKKADARYAAGDISLSELLPLRREWAQARLAYLESLRDALQAWIELKALTGD